MSAFLKNKGSDTIGKSHNSDDTVCCHATIRDKLCALAEQHIAARETNSYTHFKKDAGKLKVNTWLGSQDGTPLTISVIKVSEEGGGCAVTLMLYIYIYMLPRTR
jgi:hypothetical protein